MKVRRGSPGLETPDRPFPNRKSGRFVNPQAGEMSRRSEARRVAPPPLPQPATSPEFSGAKRSGLWTRRQRKHPTYLSTHDPCCYTQNLKKRTTRTQSHIHTCSCYTQTLWTHVENPIRTTMSCSLPKVDCRTISRRSLLMPKPRSKINQSNSSSPSFQTCYQSLPIFLFLAQITGGEGKKKKERDGFWQPKVSTWNLETSFLAKLLIKHNFKTFWLSSHLSPFRRGPIRFGVSLFPSFFRIFFRSYIYRTRLWATGWKFHNSIYVKVTTNWLVLYALRK